ncbi:MAG TPA: chaperone modulator CbpM [Gammaproteobacteria bacterium]|nr:chaperone modulator CbpM [Gammaproteobacteria bacterium]
MKIENTRVLWLGEHGEFSLQDLCELSGCTEPEIREFIECGVLTPARAETSAATFSCLHLVAAREARRLGRELELDPHGVALMIKLLDRIRELESQVRELHARLPDLT